MRTTKAPVHPGEILLADFLEPLGVTQHRLAVSIDVPPRRINEIVHGKRRISADTALRLARFFGTSERFWINLQARYDLELERDHLGSALDAITPLAVARSGRLPTSRVAGTWAQRSLQLPAHQRHPGESRGTDLGGIRGHFVGVPNWRSRCLYSSIWDLNPQLI